MPDFDNESDPEHEPYAADEPESRADDPLSDDTVELQAPRTAFEAQPAHPLDELADPQGPFRRFRIQRELGRGGCGVVYLAYDRVVRRHVALKIPQINAALSPVQRQRFLREAHLGGKFDHPHIVPVYEAGAIAGTYYLATAYCSGPTLRAWLRGRSNGIPVRLAAELVRIIAEAIEHAHAQGVLHRDLKPSNILLVPPADPQKLPAIFQEHRFEYVPKVSDFGLACLITDDNRVTGNGVPLGTASYMPPENIAGPAAQPSPATDVYGLGALLYELLTGRPPYDGPNVIETLQAVKQGDLEAPRNVRPEIPADLEAICLQCMNADPGRRYSTAQGLADDLHRYLRGEPTLARPISTIDRGVRWMRRNHVAMRMFAAALITVCAICLGLYLHSKQLTRMALALRQSNARTNAALAELHNQSLELQRQVYVQNVRLAYEARQIFDVGEFDERLADARSASTEVDLRGIEWYYLQRLSRVEQQDLWHDDEPLYYVSFSHDGRYAVATGASGRAAVFDAATGAMLSTLPPHHAEQPQEVNDSQGQKLQEINSASFSPDGTRLATAGDDGRVRIWDWRRRELLDTIEGPGGKLYVAAYHPQRPLLAVCGEAYDAWIIDPESELSFRALTGHTLAIESLEFSADGELLATASSDGTARVWRVADWSEVAAIDPGRGRLSSVSFSPDGQRLAIGEVNGDVLVWNLETNRLEFEGRHLDGVQGVDFSADGRRLAACDRGGTLRIWEPDNTARPLSEAWSGHSGRSYCVAFTPDQSRLVSVGADGLLRSWSSGGSATRRLLEEVPASPPAWDFEYLPASGTLVTAHPDALRLWNSQTGELLSELTAGGTGWSAVSASPDESVLAAQHAGGGVQCWSLPSLQPIAAFATMPARAISQLRLNSDGQTLAALHKTGETELKLFDVPTGRELPLTAPICDAIAWLPGPRLLLEAHDDRIHAWDVDRAQLLDQWIGHTSTINDLAVSQSGGRIASASSDRSVRIWQRMSDESRVLRGHRSSVRAVAFTHDERTIISGSSDGRMIFWNTATGSPALTLGPYPAGIQCLALSSADDQVFVLLENGQLLILDAPRDD